MKTPLPQSARSIFLLCAITSGLTYAQSPALPLATGQIRLIVKGQAPPPVHFKMQADSNGGPYPFQDASLPAEKRIDNLLSLMTTEEKVACLGTDPSVPRLHVRGSGHIEGLHGVALGGPGGWGRPVPVTTTQFPQSVGLGEMWDPALLTKAAHWEALEARYAFQGPDHRGGLVVRAPNTDLARDPRWGRSEESYGEDAFLTGTLAAAFARGLQGDDPRYWEAASLLKHFMANSNENGRGGSSSNFDARLMREYYSAPFRMAMQQGGADAFMTAYNAVNHTPMEVNPLLKSMVMGQWGFNGIICTDGGALKNLVTEHKAFPALPEAAAASIHAGINQFLDRYKDAVDEALTRRLITEKDVDENLRGVFRVMIKLGLLDPAESNPYAKIGKGNSSEAIPWQTPEAKALVRKLTDESIVLLKNEGSLLPLDATKLKSIAVIGQRGAEVDLDWYSGTPPYVTTPLDGIRARLSATTQIRYAVGYVDPGAERWAERNGEESPEEAAVMAAKQSEVAVVFIGNHPTCNKGWNQCPDPSEGKEAIDRKQIDLNPDQEKLIERVYAANPRTVVVLVSSFPYAINWASEHIPAILHMAHDSDEEGNGIADVLFGDYNPAGRLVVTWPRSLDQLPEMMDYNLRDGRTYMYFKGKPLYAFGYGLSYTSFDYSNLRLSARQIRSHAPLTVSVDVKNSGKRDGDEVVQLYVRHIGSKVERPLLELKGFERVPVARGATKTVNFTLKPEALEWWNETSGRWELEQDKVEILIGRSSAAIELKEAVEIRP